MHYQVQQKDLSDEAIARAVCVKVGDSPGVSYSHIAAKAYECGRTELAIKVIINICNIIFVWGWTKGVSRWSVFV